MWLPETAVDSESLDLLAQHGIRFVLLAPHQCARIRSLAAPAPAPVVKATASAKEQKRLRSQPGPKLPTPPSIPPSLISSVCKKAASIAVFFYDGPRSRAIAFEGLLNSGEGFAQRLIGGFKPDSPDAQIVHVATDGESYGHHHRYGEMALAWVLHSLARSQP